MSEFQPNTALINKQLADRSHSGTSFDPETRARQEIDGFAAEVQSVYEEVSRYARSEAQKAFLADEMARFQAGYAAKYNEYLARQGRCVSSFIAGPSGFPVRRAEKAQNSLENKISEMNEFRARATAAMIRELKKLAIEEKGGEIPALETRIKQHEELQAAMKTFNSIMRRDTPEAEKIRKLAELTKFPEDVIIKRLKPNICGDTGFPGWELSNNNANIRRMKERLVELQKKDVTPTSDIKFAGGVIQDSQEHDRVRIFFDEKPAQEMIRKLKANGWHWSPSVGAWQRKRTAQALYDAKRVTNYDEHRSEGSHALTSS